MPSLKKLLLHHGPVAMLHRRALLVLRDLSVA